MSERLSITPLGPYIGAQITGADLTRPLSDNQFELSQKLPNRCRHTGNCATGTCLNQLLNQKGFIFKECLC